MVISKLSTPGERLIHLMLASRESREDANLMFLFKQYSSIQRKQLQKVTRHLVEKLFAFHERKGEAIRLRIGLDGEPQTYSQINQQFGFSPTSTTLKKVIQDGCELLMRTKTRVFLNDFLPSIHKVDPQFVLTAENILRLPFSTVLGELWLSEGATNTFLRLLDDVGDKMTTGEFIEKHTLFSLYRYKWPGVDVQSNLRELQKELQEYSLKLRE